VHPWLITSMGLHAATTPLWWLLVSLGSVTILGILGLLSHRDRHGSRRGSNS